MSDKTQTKKNVYLVLKCAAKRSDAKPNTSEPGKNMQMKKKKAAPRKEWLQWITCNPGSNKFPSVNFDDQFVCF